MSFDPLQLLGLALALALLLLVLELVRRRLLGEEYSLVWIGSALGLLLLTTNRSALDHLAGWLGIRYGPALLLLLLGIFVFLAMLFFSVIISKQRVQIERLIEDQAILESRIRETEGKAGERPVGNRSDR